MNEIALHVLNSIQLAMLVYVLAVGLTLIFGLMNILNLAHGAFYTIGAYVAFTVAEKSGSYFLALAVAPALTFVLGFLLEQNILYPLARQGRSTHLDLALFTFGLLFATMGTVEWLYGPSFRSLGLPPILSGSVNLGLVQYPTYRLFIIGLGIAVAGGIWLLLSKTVLGWTIRAGVDDIDMIVGMGVNIRKVFALVFGLGCAFAGLAGVIAAPIFSIYSQMGVSIMIITFVVVAIGGLGNLGGSFVGALAVGFIETFTQAYFPAADLFSLYLVLVVVMAVKPQGLFAQEQRVG